MNKLTNDEIANHLVDLQGWKLRDQHIEKDFEFVDFQSAIAFVNRLVPIAEAMNHHPDWSNSYNKVHVSLTSHDFGGVTDNDLRFASAANEAATQL